MGMCTAATFISVILRGPGLQSSYSSRQSSLADSPQRQAAKSVLPACRKYAEIYNDKSHIMMSIFHAENRALCPNASHFHFPGFSSVAHFNIVSLYFAMKSYY